MTTSGLLRRNTCSPAREALSDGEGGHPSRPPGSNVYLCWASYYFSDTSGDASLRYPSCALLYGVVCYLHHIATYNEALTTGD
jgi:hypothetical protein